MGVFASIQGVKVLCRRRKRNLSRVSAEILGKVLAGRNLHQLVLKAASTQVNIIVLRRDRCASRSAG